MNFIENIRIQLILTIFLLWFGNSTLLAQEFACTHVIGFSQTRGWFSDTDTFENIVIDGNWQLIWQGGAGVDQWRNPNYGGWNQNIISSCTQNSNAPDRILLTISGPYGADEGAWAEAIQETIDNIRIKYPSVQEILLQPVVGGANHEDCFLNGTALIRASWQHKHIDNAIATLVGGDVLQGFSPEVNDCSDYVDQAGHLTTIGYENAATNIGSYYSENGNSSPVIFNGNPSGTLPTGTSDINLSVETNEIADCSYSMVADTDFNDMTPFLETSALFHSTPVTGLEDGNSYTYFVRCQDQEGNTNTIDFPIGFTIGAPSTDPVEIIIDNLDPEFATIGSWNTRTSSQYNPFNGGFRHTGAGNGNRQAIFTPNIITPGDYEVLIWYLASTRGATNTPFTVNSNGGSTTNLVNQLGQPGNGGFWLSLGVFNFAAGTSGSIVVTNDADGIALADAVRLTSVGPDGDVNADGNVNAADVLLAVQVALGSRNPTPEQFGHGDVAPLVDGVPDPDGLFDLGDVMVITRKAQGLISF